MAGSTSDTVPIQGLPAAPRQLNGSLDNMLAGILFYRIVCGLKTNSKANRIACIHFILFAQNPVEQFELARGVLQYSLVRQLQKSY